MHIGDVCGQEPILQIHEARDGQPAFNSRGTLNKVGRRSYLKLADPEIELGAQEYVEKQETGLEAATVQLRMVLLEAASKLLLEFGGKALGSRNRCVGIKRWGNRSLGK
jgi:hypothetical protein